ncbi:MAG: hypothetical protein LBG90_00040 [Spirochaetaceae bacterium]|jgi:hypothetical protein|nr:hypothetical protein [Spirochaetaceae bacterium]
MGRIKSALELALERTDSIQSDKAVIGQFEAKQQGKRLANEFLEDPKKSLEEAIKKTPKEQQEPLKQGIFDALVSQITLPASKTEEKRIEAIGKGLMAVIKDSRFAALYKQFALVIARYLEEAEQYTEKIKQQYAPKLRQKEEEIARRLGQRIKLDPFQDPEFVAFYNQHLNALKDTYQAVVDQVKEQAVLLFQP